MHVLVLLCARRCAKPSAKTALALLLGALLAVLAGVQAAGAQSLGAAAKERVAWTARVEPAAARPGQAVRLVLRAEIDDGWKMYAMDSPPPTRGVSPRLDTLAAGLSHAQSRFAQSKPKEGYDRAFRKNVRYFEGAATLRTGLAVSANAAPGEKEVGGAVTFMVCTLEKCLPPAEEHFTATVNVEAGAPEDALP